MQWFSWGLAAFPQQHQANVGKPDLAVEGMIQRSELEYQVGGSRQALRASPHNQLCRSSCLIQSLEVLVGRREPRVQCWQYWLDPTDIRPRRYTCRNHVRDAGCRSPGVFGQRPRTETARAKTRIYLNHTEGNAQLCVPE